jgi:hypothetical protein
MSYSVRLQEEIVLEYPISAVEDIAQKHFQVNAQEGELDLVDFYIQTATNELEAYQEENVSLKRMTAEIFIENSDSISLSSGSIISIPDGRLVRIESLVDDSSAAIAYKNVQKFNNDFRIKIDQSATSSKFYLTYVSGLGRKTSMIQKQAILIQGKKYYDIDRSGYVDFKLKETKTFERIGLVGKRIKI